MPFIISNDTKIYYKEFGTGIPILVLHGGPGVDHKYMLSLKPLSKQYRLIFIDQRGSGKSKINDYDTLQFKYFTADIDNIRKHFKIDQLIVIGHSFGGFVALEYAIRFGQYISHLILIDTGFNASQVQMISPKILSEWNYPDNVSKWADRFFNGNIYIFQIPYAFSKIGRAYFYNFDFTTFIKSISGKHKLKTVLLWFQKYFKGWDIYNQIGKIKNPTLIIAGEKDFQFPPDYQKIMAREINNSEIHIIEKAGHNTPIECPNEINSIIFNFLKKAA